MPTAPGPALRSEFGDIDIYLFDQLLKGRFDDRSRVLDAGCGDGRNLRYLLARGFSCWGVDRDPAAVGHVRRLAEAVGGEVDPDRFQVADMDRLPWPDASFDAVVCSAVLHFACDEAHFERMLDEMWRVLKPGGLFFARLASTIGLEGRVTLLQGRRYHLPDGSERFLVDEAMLTRATGRLAASWAEPLKTTLVQNLRSMTTWVLWKA